MDNQTKDKIKLLEFEINNLERRKQDNRGNLSIVYEIDQIINEKKFEKFCLSETNQEVEDEKIDADNNFYRERYFE